MRSFSEVSEGVEVSEVVEVSQLVVQVTSLQNDKSLRVIPERFVKHSIQFQHNMVVQVKVHTQQVHHVIYHYQMEILIH